jgi:hypothetical protein
MKMPAILKEMLLVILVALAICFLLPIPFAFGQSILQRGDFFYFWGLWFVLIDIGALILLNGLLWFVIIGDHLEDREKRKLLREHAKKCDQASHLLCSLSESK